MVATFDVDQFHDYRARRPAMSFVRDHYEAYDAPRLVVRLLHDSGGTPYLLLHGPEPDNRWEAFARAVREVVERLGVTRVVAMGSVPMAVPHTRPIAITPHANRAELVPGDSPWRGELRIPSSAQSLLELRLGEWGHDMLGFVAHIPHYLAQLDYPKAAAVLLEQVELAGRLTIDLTELHELARERETEIDRYLAVQRGGRRGGRRARAAVRRVRAGRGVGAEPARLRRAAAHRRGDRPAVRAVPGRPRRPGRQRPQRVRARRVTGTSPDTDPVQDLLHLLDLENLDDDLYRGAQPPSARARVYGGQVAAQALVAGFRSVDPEFVPHSFHSYFLLPGDYSVPIIFDVQRLRDGRSFLTRRVTARQHGRPIYHQTINFQRPEEGFDHQDAMPEVPGPDQGIDLVDLMRGRGNADADELGKEWASIDVRFLGNSRHGLEPDPRHPSQARMWVRFKEGLPEDPMAHLAAFTYASDISLLGASLAVHDVNPAKAMMASLDHTLWFHRPFRADEWWLYDQWSPSAHGGRGLAFGHVYTADGTLVATAAQEGVIRSRRP